MLRVGKLAGRCRCNRVFGTDGTRRSNRSDRTRNEHAVQLVPYGCCRGCEDSVDRHVVSRYFENWRITLYHVVEILTLHGPKRDPYFPEFSEEVRSEFRAIGRADSAAPSRGRPRARPPDGTVESARPIARNLDRTSSENSGEVRVPFWTELANRQTTWGRVDCQFQFT